jgi:hypothetical protein
MDRRTFLVGLGAFAGAIVLPKPPAVIIDMGRDLAIPTMWDANLLRRLMPVPMSRQVWPEVSVWTTVTTSVQQYGQYVKVSDLVLSPPMTLAELEHIAADHWKTALTRRILEPSRIHQLVAESGLLEQPDDRTWTG